MEWIELTENNIPEGEVLCANFQKGKYGYKEKLLGYIEFVNGKFIADSECELLENVSHFIEIHNFDI